MKRQANALTAVLENWQDVENAIDIYANSAGSALRENEIYLDSWEAKSKAVGAAWNEFVNSFVNSEWIKEFLDGAQATLSFLTKTKAAISVLAGVVSGLLVAAVLKGTFTVEGFNAALLKANILSGCIPMLIGGLVALVGGIISWGISASDTAKQIENLTTKIEEQQRTIDELNSKEKEATGLYKEYASLMSKSNAYGLTADEKENLLNISNQLVDTYGLEVQGIDAVTGAYVIGTSAINDYVEALRAERLEKQKEQNETRNDRIDKNVDKIKNLQDKNINDNLDFEDKFWVSGNWAQAEAKNEELLELIGINDKKPWWLNDTSFYGDKLRENYDALLENYEKVMASDVLNDEEKSRLKKWADAYASEKSKITSEIQSIANSIVKDVITNIQVENADTMTQSGESVLTSMLQTILPNIEDLDEDKVKEIQDKVNDFAGSYGRAFDELGAGQQKIQEKIKNNTAGLADYKELLDNQMKQLQVVEQIFGATSEEANAFREQLNKSIENNTGLYFANISKTMSESDLDTSEFDKVTSAILKLDGAMANGEITFSEYVDELNKNLDNISLESTFQGDENAAKSFFAVLNDKGKKAIQNLMAQYQNGEISQKDYLSGIADMVDYFENLSDQATLMLGVDSSELSETIDGLKEAQNELNNFKSVVQTIPDTFEEFKNGGVSSVSALTSALEKAGITSMEIGGKVRNTSKEIAQAMQENAENFAEAKEKIADDFRKNLTTIGKNLATAVNKMIEIFGEVKIVIDPPDVSLWDWLKAMFTGKTEEMVFGVKIDGEADPESWGKHFGDLAEELDWGFDDFTGGGGGNPPPYTPPGDKDKDKDKPDYEDPTDAIINRINLRSKELEQQEEYIQNQIEIAELEKDNKKQISLTNDKLDVQRQKVDALKTANDELHQMAEDLRNSTPDWDEESWFNSQGEETQAYIDFINGRIDAGASKEEIELIKDQFEKISKIKKAWVENDEERLSLTKEILQTEEDILDLDYGHSQDWIDERNTYNDWALFNDSEIDAWERVIKRLKEDYNGIAGAAEKLKEAEENLFEARKEQFNKATDFASSYKDSQKTLLQSYYDTTNAIAEAQHEINKELETSKTMYEWLDKDTQILLFNQEDYNILSEELYDIQYKADKLRRQYERDLENSTLNTIEEITSNYEMQYDMLMKSYEIAKADLEIAKKKQKLNNVLNERNVRMFINGQWQWVADTQNVIDAQSELADAEYARKTAIAGERQTESLNDLTKQQDELGTVINKFEDGVITLDEAMDDVADIFGRLPDYVEDAFTKIQGTSSKSSTSKTSYSPNINSDYVSWAKSQMATNSAKWHTASDTEKKALEKANQSLGSAIGSTYDSASGTWKHKHADGTRYTPGGLTLMGEDGIEAYISSNGHLIPINQPTVGNISSGGIVFNQDQMNNLRSLWDMSNFNLNADRSYINRQPQQIDQRQDNRIIINGMTVDSGSSDGQALINAIRRYVGNH